jgi:hypothetical protein
MRTFLTAGPCMSNPETRNPRPVGWGLRGDSHVYRVEVAVGLHPCIARFLPSTGPSYNVGRHCPQKKRAAHHAILKRLGASQIPAGPRIVPLGSNTKNCIPIVIPGGYSQVIRIPSSTIRKLLQNCVPDESDTSGQPIFLTGTWTGCNDVPGPPGCVYSKNSMLRFRGSQNEREAKTTRGGTLPRMLALRRSAFGLGLAGIFSRGVR